MSSDFDIRSTGISIAQVSIALSSKLVVFSRQDAS